MQGIFNLLYESVLVGKDEDENVEISIWGEILSFDFEIKDYVDIVDGLNKGIDFEVLVKIIGSCFVVMCDKFVCLYCVLVQFMLDIYIVEYGYIEMYVLYLVNVDSFYGIGQLFKFGEDLFYIQFVIEEGQGLFLILIVEVLLINFVCDEIFVVKDLLIKMIVYMFCFCSEVGSYGCDICGLIC